MCLTSIEPRPCEVEPNLLEGRIADPIHFLEEINVRWGDLVAIAPPVGACDRVAASLRWLVGEDSR
jgi:hypothetical protein